MIKNKYLYACLLAGLTNSGYADFSALDQQVKFFDSWVVACNNQRECSINSLPPKPVPAQASTAENIKSAEQLGFYLALERKGLADSLAMLSVQDWDAEDGDFEEGESISLHIDKQTFALGKIEAKQVNNAAFAIPSEKTPEILAALQTGTQLEVKVGESVLPVNLQGLTRSLQYMDEQQQRVDTSTALVKKGDQPFTAKPPMFESVKAVTFEGIVDIFEAESAKIKTGLQQLPIVKECLAKNAQADEAYIIERLDKEHDLYGIQCEADQYNQKFLVLVAPKNKPEQAALAQFDQGVDHSVVVGFAAYIHNEASLLSLYRQSDLGDCGNTAEWIWNGSKFILSNYYTMPECRGLLNSMNVWKLKVDK